MVIDSSWWVNPRNNHLPILTSRSNIFCREAADVLYGITHHGMCRCTLACRVAGTQIPNEVIHYLAGYFKKPSTFFVIHEWGLS